MRIPYGKSFLEFSLPENKILKVLENGVFKGKDVGLLFSKALTARTVKKLKKDVLGKKVLIVVPDSTRDAHLKEILPILLNKVEGMPKSIDIIVGTGMHKKHGPRQLKDLVGGSVFKKYAVRSHDQDRRSLRYVGKTSSGVPIVLNKSLSECDYAVSIGVIEPHLYAGYSGGAKTVAIGLAGEETINHTHSVEFLDNKLTGLGLVKNNPFQSALWEIASKTKLEFSINIVKNTKGMAVGIFCGRTKDVFRKGAGFSKKVFEVVVNSRADIVICGVGYPKDVNLYQASRAINYALNIDKPVIRKGGVVIVVAELRDAAGHGLSEKRFYRELAEMDSPEVFLKKVSEEGCIAGVHRAYMVARPMLDYNIVFVTRILRSSYRSLPFNFFDNIEDAVRFANSIVGNGSKVYVIPHALSTIARAP